MSFEIVWEANGVVFRFVNEMTSDTLITANLEALNNPKFKTINYQLMDLRDVSSYPIETSAIRRVAELDARAYKINPNVKVALVANQVVAKGLLNMYNVYFEIAGNDLRWQSEIFESIQDAYNWINSQQP